MKRFKHIINEVKELEKFQVYTDLIKYLNNEYGLLVDIEIFMHYIDIYVGKHRDNNTDVKDIKEDTISKAIKSFFNKQGYNKKAEAVWVTEYGYTIVMETDADIFEEKLKQENALYYYYYSDILGGREDKDTNKFMGVLGDGSQGSGSVRKRLKTESIEDEDKEIDKEEIKGDTSNIVLDDKFVWFFNVLDKDENGIETDVLELEEAIDILIEKEAALIVALPYVDPNPEDDNVDLVFAENPGPVIIYDGR